MYYLYLNMFLLAYLKTFWIFQWPVRLYIYLEYLLKYLSLVGMCTIYQTSSLHLYLEITHIVFLYDINIEQLLIKGCKILSNTVLKIPKW